MGRRVVLRWTSALDSSQSNRIRSSWIDATNPHFIDILKVILVHTNLRISCLNIQWQNKWPHMYMTLHVQGNVALLCYRLLIRMPLDNAPHSTSNFRARSSLHWLTFDHQKQWPRDQPGAFDVSYALFLSHFLELLWFNILGPIVQYILYYVSHITHTHTHYFGKYSFSYAYDLYSRKVRWEVRGLAAKTMGDAREKCVALTTQSQGSECNVIPFVLCWYRISS